MDAIKNFMESIGNVFNKLTEWTNNLANHIDASSLELNQTLNLLIGTIRYFIGEPMYYALVTSFYVSVVIVAIVLLPKLVSYWKNFKFP